MIAAFGYYFDKQLGQFDREARLALELAPNNPEILSRIGFLICISGRWEQGVNLAQQAHELNATSAGGW
jgi:Flp pilus assembly protein TadD